MRFLLLFTAAASLFAQDSNVKLHVDASDIQRRLFHVRMTLAAKPGPMTLLYPEWIPGEHGPTGPIADLVGLTIKSGGRDVPWRRDSVNMYAFHIDAPAGTTSLDVAFDFISPPESRGFSSGSSVTGELAVLNWNQLLLYPQGVPPDRLRYEATLRVPQSWRYGTALPIGKESGDQVEFEPASLTTLVDSPLSMGVNYNTVDLGSDGKIAHYLHIAADSARALEITPEQVAQYRNLVAETGALFGARHYRSYHFLLSLSDHIASFGLEHHESSDDRIPERSLVDEGPRKWSSQLLPHEFVHSWNGKYRRPAGLATGGFDVPMKGDLLWVYEGLTEYLGEILTPRTGLLSPQEHRETLAMTAAALDSQAGRKWRPLEDTAIAAQVLYGAREDYSEYRRGVDYYPEGTLIWLEADVLIRQRSNGARSLNDFCRAFFGGASGGPELKPYTFEDVVRTLNSIEPYDWAGFLNTRVRSTSPHAPLGGIENGGWKLVYRPERSGMWKAGEEYNKTVNLTYSIGAVVKDEGDIRDVAYGGPAYRAGIAPGGKLIAVNGRQFTPTVLREAVQATSANTAPLELLVKNGEYYKVHRVDYHGGERYPVLERDTGKADLLSAVMQPMVKQPLVKQPTTKR